MKTHIAAITACGTGLVLSALATSEPSCVRELAPPNCVGGCQTGCPGVWGDAGTEPGLLVPPESYECRPCMVYDPADLSVGPCSAAPADFVKHCDSVNGTCCFHRKGAPVSPHPTLPCSLIPSGDSFLQCNQQES